MQLSNRGEKWSIYDRSSRLSLFVRRTHRPGEKEREKRIDTSLRLVSSSNQSAIDVHPASEQIIVTMHRDPDSVRPHHFINSIPIRPSAVIPGQFTMVPPPPVPAASAANETMSIFHKERLQDVLQHGLGSYVLIDHFGLVPKLNYF